MITDALWNEGYDMERIYVIPYPIHHPDRWKHYIPEETGLSVVVYSLWERQKAESLRKTGFNVIVEDSLVKGTSGRQIRSLLASGGNWAHHALLSVARFMSEHPVIGT